MSVPRVIRGIIEASMVKDCPASIRLPVANRVSRRQPLHYRTSVPRPSPFGTAQLAPCGTIQHSAACQVKPGYASPPATRYWNQ